MATRSRSLIAGGLHAVLMGNSGLGRAGNESFSAGSEFADYRAICSRVEVMLTMSAVILAKNDTRDLGHILCAVLKWVNKRGTLHPRSVTITKGAAKELKWS